MFLSCANILGALTTSVLSFWYLSHDYAMYVDLWPWLNLGDLPVSFSLRYDGLTAIMFIVVTTVSSVVHIYSCAYMYTDPFLSRFMSYLSLFTFFMLLLVSSGNLLVLFFGWEGVGLCSYLLIGFWYTRAQAGKAATKAFVINKIGDLFLLTGIGITFMTFHTLDFSALSVLVSYCPEDMVELISIFFFIGAVGKSAQVGLHTWLPDAMEGPTPVSALIHAATMVTAGVFLIIRCSAILEHAPRILYLIAIWGGITALVSGTIGTVQNDIKKIIAYSTCSQLGYMVLACGLSFYNVGFFHLFNHAFFKALLFLSAGSVIHLMGNEQDIRRMGGLGSLSPFVYANVLLGSLALAGFPFLAGFYSKDIIIEISNTEYWFGGQALYWLTSIAAILTMYYSIRLLSLVFVDSFGGFRRVIGSHAKVTNLEVMLLGFLGLLSITSGYYFRDAFTGFGSTYFSNSIHGLANGWSALELEFIPARIKLVPVLTGIVAFVLALHLSSQTNTSMVYTYQLRTHLESCKWFYNEAINVGLVLPTLRLGRTVFEQYEKGLLERHGPVFLVGTIKRLC
jgi:proton-translocating NADH-quinone oxidoreductase chain L